MDIDVNNIKLRTVDSIPPVQRGSAGKWAPLVAKILEDYEPGDIIEADVSFPDTKGAQTMIAAIHTAAERRNRVLNASQRTVDGVRRVFIEVGGELEAAAS